MHVLNNAAVVSTALLWGEGDPVRAIGLAVAAGWDTDSTGATVGSVVGAMRGASGLPEHLVDPLHDTLRSSVRDFDHIPISELAARTVWLARRADPAPAPPTS